MKEKNCNKITTRQDRLRKVLLVVTLKLFIFILPLHGLNAACFSQGKLTLSFVNEKLEKVLEYIEENSDYSFVYRKEILNGIRVKDLQLKEVTINEVLNTILLSNKFEYSIAENGVVVIRKETEQQQPQKQTITLKGSVIDKNGEELIGAAVLLKGTKYGVSTNMSGSFELKVSDTTNLTLLVKFLGMKDKEVKYKGEKSLRIILEEDDLFLSEVVVTGYQTIAKERMTGAVDVITSADIANKGYSNIDDVLKGQSPGLVSMNLSGRPGASSSIRIRGINALTGDTNPIWIIDGMPLQGEVPSISMGGTEFTETVLTSGIGNIPPDDIESITILKDAAATAIYGSRAANGVIVITTKRGTAGKSYISYQSTMGISEAPANRLRMMNSSEKIDFERGIYEDFPGLDIGGRAYQLYKNMEYGLISREQGNQELERLRGINTNWFNEIFRRGIQQNHNITLSGGNETTQYYGNIYLIGERGIVPNNKYENLGGSLKLTHNFNKRLRINFDIRSNARNDRTTASAINPLHYATYASPYERLYNENGDYEYDRSYLFERSQINNGQKYNVNILEDLMSNRSDTKYQSSQISLKLELQRNYSTKCIL